MNGQSPRHQNPWVLGLNRKLTQKIKFCHHSPLVVLIQRFSIPVLAPPRSAYFACLSLLTHLIQIISLLEVCSMHELCSDWHAPYSLSRGNPLKFTSFRNIHSFMDLRCATSSRTNECDIIYLCKYIQFEFTSCTLICTLNGIYTFASNWNHGGISCDVHFEGHLRSNRTNIWSDKSNIRNMQSGGGTRTGIENRCSNPMT